MPVPATCPTCPVPLLLLGPGAVTGGRPEQVLAHLDGRWPAEAAAEYVALDLDPVDQAVAGTAQVRAESWLALLRGFAAELEAGT
ncbi:hypothetical protein C7C46_31785 [Streptomyces tateyamensis]|uniref:Uncharacterized protein n=1 Tax=Streptomyces tateyamensis TaxID=565073 RepID=A0A2V4MSW5_9ACTN|nr:hypothetical protein [Streptomyces tateyamensis]PYC66074.1 hypothetical protein C7C46_31785 [Streptomyces tateyamensis]